MTLSELARELDTYGGAVRFREIEGDTEGDKMIAEFTSRAIKAIGSDESADKIKIVTRNSFFVVMKRKT